MAVDFIIRFNKKIVKLVFTIFFFLMGADQKNFHKDTIKKWSSIYNEKKRKNRIAWCEGKVVVEIQFFSNFIKTILYFYAIIYTSD